MAEVKTHQFRYSVAKSCSGVSLEFSECTSAATGWCSESNALQRASARIIPALILNDSLPVSIMLQGDLTREQR
jgi:hypothetical protein